MRRRDIPSPASPFIAQNSLRVFRPVVGRFYPCCEPLPRQAVSVGGYIKGFGSTSGRPSVFASWMSGSPAARPAEARVHWPP